MLQTVKYLLVGNVKKYVLFHYQSPFSFIFALMLVGDQTKVQYKLDVKSFSASKGLAIYRVHNI